MGGYCYKTKGGIIMIYRKIKQPQKVMRFKLWVRDKTRKQPEKEDDTPRSNSLEIELENKKINPLSNESSINRKSELSPSWVCERNLKIDVSSEVKQVDSKFMLNAPDTSKLHKH